MRSYSLSLLALCVLSNSACVRREFESELGELGNDNQGGNVALGGSAGEATSGGKGSTSGAGADGEAGSPDAGRSNGGRAGAPIPGRGGVTNGGVAGVSNGGAAGTPTAGVAGESNAGAPWASHGGDGGASEGGAAGSFAAGRGGVGGVAAGGGGGSVPKCVPSTEICNGIDDDCDSLIDLDDEDSGLEFGFSAFEPIASDVAAPAYLDVAYAEAVGRYGVLWAPATSQADEIPSARLYILEETGELPGSYVEIPEIAPVSGIDTHPRLASNGTEFGIVWSWSADSQGVRLLVVDAVDRSRVGSIVDLDELDIYGSSIASDGSAWYVAGGRPYSMPQPTWIARVVSGEVPRSSRLDAEGVWPVLTAAGSTVGVTWAHDTDDDMYHAEEMLFSYGTSLAELTGSDHFQTFPDLTTAARLMSASSGQFTIAPTYPGSLILRFDTQGEEICRAIWSDDASTTLHQLVSSEAGSVAIATLDDDTEPELGVLRITNDCQVEDALPILPRNDFTSLELATAVGSSGAILVRSDGDSLQVAHATKTWCAPD